MASHSRTTTGFLSSRSVFSPKVGSMVSPGRVRGYYIDFDFKAKAPDWPPAWLGVREKQLHVHLAQWGLGCYERYLKGEGHVWLGAARRAADHLIGEQGRDGAWVHLMPMPHTFPLDPPWISGMAQGEGASLLVRIHAETGEQRYAEGAHLALGPFARSVAEGGVRVDLDGGPFFEEYPTKSPSLVLNGGIFALWGAYDVASGLADATARASFDQGLEALARNIERWDTGRWSLYDLYERLPMRNLASSAYHQLHIRQLRAMGLIAARPELERAAERFQDHQDRRLNRMDSFARKAAFRIVVPRNRVLGRRMPWTRTEAGARG